VGVGSLRRIVERTTSAERRTMRIFIFKSETSPLLHAFSDDMVGSKLPEQFSPWHAIGVVRPDSPPPHHLSRSVIEASIASTGFQLWRMKK
jgi:hypothetical protein